MAKYKKIFDKPKSNFIEKEQKIELMKAEIPTQKTSKDMKSIILSGSKYAYIVVAAALLSGIFTPLTIGADIEIVILAMLSIFLGLGGGIVIFLGIKCQKSTTILICGGLGMMIVSLILIYEIAERSLFG
jgi:hypothetical protein|tara:strand:- start:164 stop:553 length:390 start_codon:yes stop_codon:yes gene_type:complete